MSRPFGTKDDPRAGLTPEQPWKTPLPPVMYVQTETWKICEPSVRVGLPDHLVAAVEISCEGVEPHVQQSIPLLHPVVPEGDELQGPYGVAEEDLLARL